MALFSGWLAMAEFAPRPQQPWLLWGTFSLHRPHSRALAPCSPALAEVVQSALYAASRDRHPATANRAPERFAS